MRRFITTSLDVICQVAIVLLLIVGLGAGWENGGLFGAIGGLIGAFLVSVVFFGALFVLLDISDHTRRAADALERQR